MVLPRRPSQARASALTSSAGSGPSASRFAAITAAARRSRSTRTALRGAAAQGLDRERARAGEEVEHARSLDGVAEDREEGLADAVGRRPGVEARRRLKAAAAEFAGDDAEAVHDGVAGRGWRVAGVADRA